MMVGPAQKPLLEFVATVWLWQRVKHPVIDVNVVSSWRGYLAPVRD